MRWVDACSELVATENGATKFCKLGRRKALGRIFVSLVCLPVVFDMAGMQLEGRLRWKLVI